MPFIEHLKNTLKINPAPTPIPRMVLCSISTTFPLLLGYYKHQLPLAIFGSLAGFVLILNDHFGPLKQRIVHSLITFILLSGAFYLGALLYGQIALIALQFLTAAGLPGIVDQFGNVMIYCFFSFINYIVCLILVYFFFRHSTEFMARKRKIFKKIIHEKVSTRFAIIFSLTITIRYLAANTLKLSHCYWVTQSALLFLY